MFRPSDCHQQYHFSAPNVRFDNRFLFSDTQDQNIWKALTYKNREGLMNQKYSKRRARKQRFIWGVVFLDSQKFPKLCYSKFWKHNSHLATRLVILLWTKVLTSRCFDPVVVISFPVPISLHQMSISTIIFSSVMLETKNLKSQNTLKKEQLINQKKWQKVKRKPVKEAVLNNFQKFAKASLSYTISVPK